MYIRIPKGNGKVRWVYSPTREEKSKCRLALPKLHEIQESVCDLGIVHGFVRNRNAVTNARAHTGRSYTLSLDLQDFFPSVTHQMVQDAAGDSYRHFIYQCGLFISKSGTEENPIGALSRWGIAEQGLPSSPLMANIAFSPLDKLIKAEFPSSTYTRYADDLTISWDEDPSLREYVLNMVRQIVSDHGFRLNEKKTRFQDGKFGRRVITGVAVDWMGVHPTRDSKRKLRAAKHNGWKRKQRGYEEWCKMSLPNGNSWTRLIVKYVLKKHRAGQTVQQIRHSLEHEWAKRSSHPDWKEAVQHGLLLASML